ncbi:MAG: lectin like domain-containing protein [Candidatus Borkfalkiaceae bacterium]|nr:lectin like domain-containing protein [Christensenellaceae bacterium]
MKKSGLTTLKYITVSILSAIAAIGFSAVKTPFSARAATNETVGNSFYDSAERIINLSRFDPRDELTPVKDQGDTNLCWAYSAINASEASILKNKIGNKDSLRLNPKALAYRKYVRKADPLGNTANYYKNADDWTARPGHIEQTTALLSMWQGPIGGDKPAADVWENSLYRFESANLISSGKDGEARIMEIKRAIAEYGAVTASCYYDGGTKQYYNDAGVKNGVPHAITLVGWDDDIDESLFSPGQVTRNGGWLVKNSYSDNGYFWLTYESKIATTTAWTFTYAPKDSYDYNYYYDNNEDSFGLLKLKQFANVYEAKKGTDEKEEYVEAVNVGFVGNDVNVKIKVYTNLSGWGQTSVEKGTLAAEKAQTFKYGGYNTIKLDNPVKVSVGTYFSIVVEVSNPDGNAFVSVVQSDTKKPSFRKTSDGYDYISNGGCIARIKAYTKVKDAAPEHTHNYGEPIPRIAPTCSSAGFAAHYRCAECNEYFDENKKPATYDSLIIAKDPDAHNFGAWIEEIAPTVNSVGTKAHKDCLLCNKHFDSADNEIYDLEIAKINAYLITVNGGVGGGLFEEGRQITVTANAPKDGETFSHWEDENGNTAGTDINYTFTVTKETVLTAIYEKSPSGGDSENNSGDNTGNGSDGTTSSSDRTGLSCAADAGVAANGILIIGLCVTAIIRFALKKLKNRIAGL